MIAPKRRLIMAQFVAVLSGADGQHRLHLDEYIEVRKENTRPMRCATGAVAPDTGRRWPCLRKTPRVQTAQAVASSARAPVPEARVHRLPVCSDKDHAPGSLPVGVPYSWVRR